MNHATESLRDAVRSHVAAHRVDRAWDCAAEAFASDSKQVSSYAQNLLRYLVPKLPEAAWTKARLQLCAEVGATCPPTRQRVGQVSFPVVCGSEGHFVTVCATTAPKRSILGQTDPRTRSAINDAIDAAHAITGRRDELEISFSDTDWTGGSCGLAVAIAACSALTGQAVSRSLSATARVKPSGEVVAVDHLDAKLRLRGEAQPLGQLLVAKGSCSSHLAVVEQGTLSAALEHLRLDRELAVDEQLERIRSFDRRSQWRKAAQRAEVLLAEPELEDNERIELLAIALTAANHDADVPRQQRLLEQVDILVAHDTSFASARAIATLAVADLDLGHGERAEAFLLSHLDRFTSAKALIHLEGTLALLRTRQGDLEGAEVLRRRNCERTIASERGRCLGDHADILRRLGRYQEALEQVEAGITATKDGTRRRAYQVTTQPFLNLHRARILIALNRSDEAAPILEQLGAMEGRDPALRARLELAVLRGDRSAVERERSGGDSPVIELMLDRALALLGDADATSRLEQHLGSTAPVQQLIHRIPY